MTIFIRLRRSPLCLCARSFIDVSSTLIYSSCGHEKYHPINCIEVPCALCTNGHLPRATTDRQRITVMEEIFNRLPGINSMFHNNKFLSFIIHCGVVCVCMWSMSVFVISNDFLCKKMLVIIYGNFCIEFFLHFISFIISDIRLLRITVHSVPRTRPNVCMRYVSRRLVAQIAALAAMPLTTYFG